MKMLKNSGSSDFWFQLLTMRSKEKWKNINTHPIDRSSLLTYFTLAWQSNAIFTNWSVGFLMWSQINLRLSIRRTGGRQIDFKVSSHFECQNIFRKSKSQIPKILKIPKVPMNIFQTNIRLNFRLIFLWSQINALLLIRALGALQIDFKVFINISKCQV